MLFNASRRPLLIPRSIAASTPCLCLRIVRANFTNGFSRERDAQASHASSPSGDLVLGELVDVAQFAVEQERAVHGLVGQHDVGELEQLPGGLLGGVLEQAVAGAFDPLALAAGRATVLVVLAAADLVSGLAGE